jgi:dipeptidase E
MKLYLSSIDVPTPDDLSELLGMPLSEASVALLPNAKDYYSKRARDYKVGELVSTLESLGLRVDTVDLRKYNEAATLKKKLSEFNLIWAMGGNTFCLRYEMKRSGFEDVIKDLLVEGSVYGGDSAGALVAGQSIGGIESADIPQFAESIIEEGLKLVPYVVLPHIDNSEFAEAVSTVRGMHREDDNLIELKDSQAVIFNDNSHRIVEAKSSLSLSNEKNEFKSLAKQINEDQAKVSSAERRVTIDESFESAVKKMAQTPPPEKADK